MADVGSLEGPASGDETPRSKVDEEGGTEAVRDAIEEMVGRNEVSGVYLLVALALAVAWWQTVGAMSAWVAGFGLVVLSFAAPSVLAAVSAVRWPTADAVVVESAVLTESEAREYAGLATGVDASETGYVPLVRYRFTADGTPHETARVSPFDDTLSKRRWASALVDRYPPNSHHTVRYDPADPTRAYLRPWVRSKYVLFLAIGAVFVAAAGWVAAGLPGGAPAVMTAVGLVVVAFGLRQFRAGFGSRNWPTVEATVTATGISVKGGGEDSGTTYVPELHYEYEVDGTAYVGSRYSFGGAKDPAFDSREAARTWIDDHWPVEGRIAVHYDPDRPDVSVVEPGAWRSLVTVLFGLVFLGGAVLFYVTAGTSVPG